MRLSQIGLERMDDIGLVRTNRITQAHERTAASVDIKRGVRLKVGALIADDARNFLGVHGTLLVLVLKHTTRDDLVHTLELQAVH